MITEKSFHKAFIIVQLLAIILIGAFIFPFALDIFEDWSEIPQFPIWVIEIFFGILCIIFVVVGVKLAIQKQNALKVVHIVLDCALIAVYAVQLIYCFRIMSSI